MSTARTNSRSKHNTPLTRSTPLQWLISKFCRREPLDLGKHPNGACSDPSNIMLHRTTFPHDRPHYTGSSTESSLTTFKMLTAKAEAARLVALLVLSTSRMINAESSMDFYGWKGTVAVDSTVNATDVCPLACENGSVCERGQQNLNGQVTSSSGARLNFHKELNRNGWHCSCPQGYTGLECQTAFQRCVDGERVCYHGGICKTDSSTEGFYGTGESHCDCSAALDPEIPFLFYSGDYCETATVHMQSCAQSDYCQNDGVCQNDPEQPCQCPDGYSGKQCETKFSALSCTDSGFCRNGATCTDDSEHPCECTQGYFGEQCQFAKEVVVVPECTKACVNGGECMFEDNSNGTSNSAFLMRKQYCECPESQYGEFCEKNNEICGGKYCQNGGDCFEVKLSNGITEHMCDCLPAYTDEQFFSGEFCQYPSTSFCSEADDPNGRQFCTNGGTCPDSSHGPCKCPEGFAGPRCAFKDGEDGSDYAECDLPCLHGGTCQKGIKDLQEVYEKFSDEIVDIFNETHSDFEHCVCPDGFYGIRCEYEVEECSETHVCFHGSTCRETASGSSCVCEDSDHLTAGLFCEFFATEDCDESLAPSPSDYRGFCTNGGLCVVTDGELGCSCPDGFEGPHCEFRIVEESGTPTIEHHTSRTMSRTGKILAVVSVFCVFGAVINYMLFYSMRRRRAGRRGPADGVWKENLAPAGEDSRQDAPVSDARGNWDGLSDVGII